jgi:hypothetical protein
MSFVETYLTVIQIFAHIYFFAGISAAIFFAIRLYRGEPTKKIFLNYLKVLGACILSSAFPFMALGLVFGLPSTLLASMLITFIFRKELA